MNKKRDLFFNLFFVLLPVFLQGRGSDEFAPGIQELYRLDWLPRLKQSVEIGSISSYDRSGGNDDGFSGKYSSIRKEAGGLVLVDLKGHGCIYRIWTPTPTDDWMAFFFDGEKKPRIRIRFRDLFTGNQPPFLHPIAGSGAGGFYSYYPLTFRKSCKIIMESDQVQFYQVNYALYPKNIGIKTVDAMPDPAEIAHLERAVALWNSAGKDISSHCAGPGETIRIIRTHETLAPGKTVQLFDIKQPGRITGLWLMPADALADKDRSILIRMTWDNQASPAVYCPVGDFFGASWGDPAMQSLMLGTRDNTDYSYFPMPFDWSARVELISEATDGEPVEIQAELAFAAGPRTSEEGMFCALWRRENPTAMGKPFTFLDFRGQGHVVGCMLQAQGLEPGATPFFEGDDQTWIDGRLAIHGTGSEDFFNGGWYDVPDRWEQRRSFPVSGCLDYKKHLGRSAGYRFMLADAYAFRKSILHTIEHAPERNELATDYCAVTFLYTKDHPARISGLDPPESRKTLDFNSFRFTPGWNVPVHAFSFRNVALEKKTETLGGEEVRFFSMKAGGDDIFGQPFVAFDFDIPQTGKYRVSMEAVTGSYQGIVQMFRDESPLGDPVDLFSKARQKSGMLDLGSLSLQKGSNTLYFKLMGKNPDAAGMGFNPVSFIFTKEE
ncbi:DUF2961 domain-containing protein [bacterium]|nr:DUF2961 domain-containing protein [bacterium]